MESIFLTFGICTIIALLGSFLGIYLYFREQYKFWKKLNIPYIPASFPLGNLSGVGSKKRLTDFGRYIYDMSAGKSVIGIYMISKPVLIIRDPELCKAILIKDFMTFHDKGFYSNEKEDRLWATTIGITKTKWKYLRSKLTPMFTSGKMKMMFPLVLQCSEELKDLLKQPASRGEVVEMKEIAACYTTDIITSCTFGIQTNSLKNPHAIFRVMGKKMFELSSLRILKFFFLSCFPEICRRLRLTLLPKDVTEFFVAAVKDIMGYREKNNIERNDFLQMLIRLTNQGRLNNVNDAQSEEIQQGDESDRFTFMETAAQVFSFYFAGIENPSTTTQFALYELAVNPDIQNRLRDEIRETIAKDNGKLTYEGIHSMQYLGRIIDETLRKYPPTPFLQRECNKNFRIPNTDCVIPKGTQVQVSISGFHHDPEYYPNPEKFDPDRFTEEEKAARSNDVYLPFGDGPRTCIGMRFALMLIRVGLVTLIENFRFEVSEKTKMPLELDMKSFSLSPEGGMHLKIKAL